MTDRRSTMKDGGPAFPHCEYETINGDEVVVTTGVSGMSLHDYFAAAALVFMAHPDDCSTAEAAAKFAHEVADAMLAEREKRDD